MRRGGPPTRPTRGRINGRDRSSGRDSDLGQISAAGPAVRVSGSYQRQGTAAVSVIGDRHWQHRIGLNLTRTLLLNLPPPLTLPLNLPLMAAAVFCRCR